jgi:ABC-type transport system involved in multi-copper enzyme maturation permease subunit
MKWLVWKDYRVNRLVIITTLVLLAAPHLLVAILIWRGAIGGPNLLPPAGCFVGSSLYSLSLLQLAFALLGGNSIAGERIDRSAEFLAYLPVSRGRILASKLLVAVAAVPLVWLPNLVVLAIAYASTPTANLPQTVPPAISYGLSTIAITGLTFFCVAWLFSCMLQSPTFSVAAGLIVPLLVVTGMQWVAYLLDLGTGLSFDELSVCWYCGLCLVISAASFSTGTLYYLRRVEP